MYGLCRDIPLFLVLWLNLRIQAVTLHILEKLENRVPYSSCCGCTTSTAGFKSGSSLVRFRSGLLGHLDGGEANHGGPSHQSDCCIRSAGNIPLERRSAGLQ